GVDHGGHAGAKTECVGLHAVVAGPGVADARGVEQMRVDVHQTGRDVEAAGVDDLAGARRIDGGGDFGDLAGLNGHVAERVDVVSGIDDVSAFEQQVILGEGRA